MHQKIFFQILNLVYKTYFFFEVDQPKKPEPKKKEPIIRQPEVEIFDKPAPPPPPPPKPKPKPKDPSPPPKREEPKLGTYVEELQVI